MSHAQVATETQAGGDRVFLGTLGQIDGLQWSHVFPGGPEKAQFNFHRDARYDHRALEQGRRLIIYVGAGRAWVGQLTDPGRDSPWQIAADGIAVLAQNMRADGASGNPWDLNEVFDAALARGLPAGTRPSLPTGASDRSSTGYGHIRPSFAAVLSRVLLESGSTWMFDNDANLQLVVPLSAPSHLLLTDDPGGGRTVNGHISALRVHYRGSTSGKTETTFVRNSALEGRGLPMIERALDLRDRGTLTSAQAALIAQAVLLLWTGSRTPWQSQMSFTRGMVRTLNGSIVDPATVQPPMLARMLLTAPDHQAETNFASVQDMLVGRTTYFDDTGLLQVEPFDFEKSDFKSMLGKAA